MLHENCGNVNRDWLVSWSNHFTTRHERAFERDDSGGGACVEVGEEGIGNGVGLVGGVAQKQVDRVGFLLWCLAELG